MTIERSLEISTAQPSQIILFNLNLIIVIDFELKEKLNLLFNTWQEKISQFKRLIDASRFF